MHAIRLANGGENRRNSAWDIWLLLICQAVSWRSADPFSPTGQWTVPHQRTRRIRTSETTARRPWNQPPSTSFFPTHKHQNPQAQSGNVRVPVWWGTKNGKLGESVAANPHCAQPDLLDTIPTQFFPTPLLQSTKQTHRHEVYPPLSEEASILLCSSRSLPPYADLAPSHVSSRSPTPSKYQHQPR
jgi:hypothetical protein